MTEKSVVGKACSKLFCSLALIPDALHLPLGSNAIAKQRYFILQLTALFFFPSFTFSKKSKGKLPLHAQY